MEENITMEDNLPTEEELNKMTLKERNKYLTPRNFIEQEIEKDIENKDIEEIITRFPPEPNGFLHIGHCKAICTDFETAKRYGGKTNLRFDDTNPTAEDKMYEDAIKRDIEWLGYNPDQICYASNYYEKFYDFAVKLIKDGKAYVDDQTPEQIRLNRGKLTERGKNSPFRNRSIEENLDLIEKYNAEVMITKESGDIGGVIEKIEAANEKNVAVIMIQRPKIDELNKNDIVSNLDELDIKLNSDEYLIVSL